MLSNVRSWVRAIKMFFAKFTLWIVDTIVGVITIFPELLCHRVFFYIPIISFYPKTLLAIDTLKVLPDTEQTLAGQLYSSTLEEGNAYFDSISKIIQVVYQVQGFDQIKFKRSHEYLTGIDPITNELELQGGRCFLELLNNNKVQKTIYKMDEQFSSIRRELDLMVRKRLSIVFLIISFALLVVIMTNK